MKMKKKTYVAGLLSIVVGVTLLSTGCNKKPNYEHTTPIRNIITYEVDDKASSKALTVSGSVTPTEVVKLSYKLAGVIQDIYPNEGDRVEKGQLISTLNSEDYEMQVRAAQADQSIANAGIGASQAQLEAAQQEYEAAVLKVEKEIPSKVKQAKTQYDLTAVTYERIKKLHEAGAVPTNQFDEISAKLEVDKETYQQALDAKEIADANLRSVSKKLDALRSQISIADAQSQKAGVGIELANSKIADTSIYSPFNGVILKKIMSEGETISAGYPIVAIGKTDQVWVEIGVSDQYINKLQKGQKATVEVYGVDGTLEGTIDEIGQLADSKTRTFTVKIKVDNQDGNLKPGMIGKVSINLDNSETVLVPIASVINLNQGDFIFIYDEETETVSRREVVTGSIIEDKIEIIEGLEQGDVIVIEGQFVLRDGDKVNAVKEGQND